MKQKLFTILKPLVADKGLSKEEIEGLAEIFAKNLTETSTDAEINNVANGIVPIAEMMQKSGNRLATSVKDKFKGYVDPSTLEKYNEWVKAQEKPEPPTPPTPPQTMTPEDIQKMIAEQIKNGIEAGLKPFQEQQQREQLHSMLFAHEKVKNIPDVFRNRYTLDKAENLETLATQIESDYTAMKQELVRSGLYQETPKAADPNDVDPDIQELQDMVAAASK